jgi:hypothetical protein
VAVREFCITNIYPRLFLSEPKYFVKKTLLLQGFFNFFAGIIGPAPNVCIT